MLRFRTGPGPLTFHVAETPAISTPLPPGIAHRLLCRRSRDRTTAAATTLAAKAAPHRRALSRRPAALDARGTAGRPATRPREVSFTLTRSIYAPLLANQSQAFLLPLLLLLRGRLHSFPCSLRSVYNSQGLSRRRRRAGVPSAA